jgi:hypothetical protein
MIPAAAHIPMIFPNSKVNTALNSKEYLAQDHGISCDFQVDLPDNSRRSLSLKTWFWNHYFSYEIVNTKENDITETSGRFQTDR